MVFLPVNSIKQSYVGFFPLKSLKAICSIMVESPEYLSSSFPNFTVSLESYLKSLGFSFLI